MREDGIEVVLERKDFVVQLWKVMHIIYNKNVWKVQSASPIMFSDSYSKDLENVGCVMTLIVSCVK